MQTTITIDTTTMCELCGCNRSTLTRARDAGRLSDCNRGRWRPYEAAQYARGMLGIYRNTWLQADTVDYLAERFISILRQAGVNKRNREREARLYRQELERSNRRHGFPLYGATG